MFGGLFVICLKISLPFIQLLLFEQDTSIFYLNSHISFRNVLEHIEAGVEAPLLVIKISKKTSPELEVFFLNETKQKLILAKTPTQRATNIRERTGYNV